MDNLWYKVKDNHYLLDSGSIKMIGIVFKYNQKKTITWFNPMGKSWKNTGDVKKDIDYWLSEGFEQCNEESAKELLQKYNK